MEERFIYDRLDRLTGVVEGGDTTGVFVYDSYGRMTMKRLHGAMVFDNTAYGADGRPHALGQARMYAEPPEHHLRYTSFDKILSIQQDEYLTPDYGLLRFEYGYEHQRLRSTEFSSPQDSTVKDYVGNCEFVRHNGVSVSERTYISGPLGVFAVLDSHVQPLGKGMYYVHPDHLGSWTTVTNRGGLVLQDVRFDPWGTPYYSDSTTLTQATSMLFDRGFTGHEHLMRYGLINMNGRVYDPVTSTFLSVDNYVQDPSSTQNFNRFAYCMNNPLKYVDPDGEWAHLAIGALIGGIVNLATNWSSVNTFGEGLAYFGIGAAAGIAGALTGGAAAGIFGTIGFAGASLTGVASGFVGGFTTGAGNAWIQGATFGKGLLAGTKAGGMGAIMGGLTSGVMGGINAVKHGGNFWTGKGAAFDFSVSDILSSRSEKFDQKYYKQNVDKYEAALKNGTKEIHGFEVGDLNVDRLSTSLESTNPDVMNKLNDMYILENGFYSRCSGGSVYGTTIKSSILGNHSEIFISPGVVDGYLFNYDIAQFHAVVGHELTHAYHIYLGFGVSQNGPSEWAAQDYTKAVYNFYNDFRAKSITVPFYDNSWKVPASYPFSIYNYP